MSLSAEDHPLSQDGDLSAPLDWLHAAAAHGLPVAVVDLAALRSNRALVVAALDDRPVTMRLATRALRSTAVLRHLLLDTDAEGNPTLAAGLQGLACDTVGEVAALAKLGFDDFLLHAPVCLPAEAARLAGLVADGSTVIPTVDSVDHLALLSSAAVDAGVEIGVCIDVDVSWQPAAEVRFGRMRSALEDVTAARELAARAGDLPGLSVVGVSAWAAQVADARRPGVSAWWMSPLHGWMRTRSLALAADRRVAVVESLKADGHPIAIVNGGSTATIAQTARDASVTEITVGGAFLAPTRTDGCGLDLTPALHLVTAVCRIPDSEHVVVRGLGGSGEGAQPVHPPGLRPTSEGLGSVQAPLLVPNGRQVPALGTPVVFRPERVAPVLDRFDQVLLVDAGAVVETAHTWRGLGVSEV